MQLAYITPYFFFVIQHLSCPASARISIRLADSASEASKCFISSQHSKHSSTVDVVISASESEIEHHSVVGGNSFFQMDKMHWIQMSALWFSESYFSLEITLDADLERSNRLKMHMLKFEKNIICKMSSFLQSPLLYLLLDFWCIRAQTVFVFKGALVVLKLFFLCCSLT